VLAGFSNAVFLLFVAVFMLFESGHMLFKAPPTHADGFVAMAAIGIGIDLIGFALFHRHFLRTVRGLNLDMVLPSAAAAALRHAKEGRTGTSANAMNGIADAIGVGSRETNLIGVVLHIIADSLHHFAYITASLLTHWRYGARTVCAQQRCRW
jgi:Co/Zn/Cd efflux system component